MKELPYFKFFPDEWMNGDVTLLSEDLQGIYLKICCYYWKRNCDMTVTKLKQRYNTVITEQWDELFLSGVLKQGLNDRLIIKWLDLQWSERSREFNQKSKAGKIGMKNRWADNTVITEHNNKDKEEDKEKNKDKDIYRKFDHLSITIDEFKKLEYFWRKETIDSILDRIENYKDNKKYKSLYLTAKNWIKDEPKRPKML